MHNWQKRREISKNERSDQTDLVILESQICEIVPEFSCFSSGAVFELVEIDDEGELRIVFSSQGEDMFPLAVISLHFQADFAHSLGSSARLDFVCLVALCSGFGASFLVELLLSALAFPLETFKDVDGASLREVSWSSGTGCV